MARAGAKGLGTITNLEKMAIEIPVHKPRNRLVKTASGDLGMLSSLCLFTKLASPLTGLCMSTKKQ